VHDFQWRRAAPCRNVSESTDLLDGNDRNDAAIAPKVLKRLLTFQSCFTSTGKVRINGLPTLLPELLEGPPSSGRIYDTH